MRHKQTIICYGVLITRQDGSYFFAGHGNGNFMTHVYKSAVIFAKDLREEFLTAKVVKMRVTYEVTK